MDLDVDRTDLRRTRLTPGRPLPDEPSRGSVLVRVELFALTANNVTYAVMGDVIDYWRFFPVPEPGWGRVPVWGFGEIVASSSDGVAAGARFYGYWPMSSHVLLEPTSVGRHSFTDGAAHRADLPAVYNRYQWAAPVGAVDVEAEERAALLRPLFTTSFLLDDWLGEQKIFGADSVIISSASSKTALGLAQLLSAREGVDVVGLTSSRHDEFVRSTGVYDDVVTYDELLAGTGLPAGQAVYVDIAGDAEVLAAVHGAVGDRLRRSVRVGFTHHEAAPAAVELPGPAPQLFFAPDQVRRRATEWGADGFTQRLDDARVAFDAGAGAAVTIDRRRGAEEIRAAWVELVDGAADPAAGIICSW